MTVYRLMWKSPLNPASRVTPLDGNPLLIEMVDKSPEPHPDLSQAARQEFLRPGLAALRSGRAIEPEHVPTTVMIEKGRAALYDYYGCAGLVFISPRFKSIVDALEPNIHQFFPIKVVDKDHKLIGEHWIWVILQVIDAIDARKSNFVLKNGYHYVRPNDEKGPIVFSRSKIDNHHFWRENYKRPKREWIMLSQQAADMMRSAGLIATEYTEYEVQ